MTTIQISIETRDQLMKLGKKGDTYNDIIKKLLKPTTVWFKDEK